MRSTGICTLWPCIYKNSFSLLLLSLLSLHSEIFLMFCVLLLWFLFLFMFVTSVVFLFVFVFFFSNVTYFVGWINSLHVYIISDLVCGLIYLYMLSSFVFIQHNSHHFCSLSMYKLLIRVYFLRCHSVLLKEKGRKREKWMKKKTFKHVNFFSSICILFEVSFFYRPLSLFYRK